MKSIELMSSGQWHMGFAPGIGEALDRASTLCYRLNTLPPYERSQRNILIREILGSIGNDFVIHSPFRCDIGDNIHVGNRFICNFNVSILDEAEVRIGNNVFIGPNTTICTITHSLDATQRNEGIMRALSVTIEDDVWIGMGVNILPGVCIGKGSVIAAGSLVTKSVPPGVLAMGSPCRVVRKITEADKVSPVAYADDEI